jgi:cbb3-type cytochrome oxidase cytochrome c subunit
VRHFEDPRAVVQRSIMPTYAHLQRNALDFAGIQSRVDAMAMLGVPYGDAIDRAPEMAREQARTMAASIEASGGPAGLGDREVIALIAYLQRLGRDIQQAPAAAAVLPVAPPAAPAPGGTP